MNNKIKPMNMKQARELAYQRWGKYWGKVLTSRYVIREDGTRQKMVGRHGTYDYDCFNVYGCGWTWEEAFEKATKNGY
jgi:hypothetical protein